jgi:lysophospholipid hydrolase
MKPEKIGSKVKAVKEFVAPGEGPRFRKRDRIAFLSRRAIRNAKAVGTYIRGGQGKKRRDMAKLVKRVWQRGSPNSSMSRELRPGLPEEYLEEDGVMEAGVTDAVPEALVIVLKNLRVFGHFENTILLELMKNIEYVTVRQNEYLFRVGDPDCSMFIVESGSLSVCYEGSEREEKIKLELKQVNAGEPIVSLCRFVSTILAKFCFQ